MDNNPDNDDYELLPRHELDELRREVTGMKKNSLMEGDKGRALIDSIDKLTTSINRFIIILDDAQKDIIEEYQSAKPAEKLNKLMEQNQMIAKALLAMNDTLTSTRNQSSQPTQSDMSGSSNFQQPMMQQSFGQTIPNNQRSNQPMFQAQQKFQSPSMNMDNMNSPGDFSDMPLGPMPSLDGLPPLNNTNDMPSFGNIPPAAPQKKKFLGFM